MAGNCLQMYHIVCYACTHIAAKTELSCIWHFFASWNDIILASYYTSWDMNYFLVWILVQWRTDRQKAMHMSPPCISTGVLKKWSTLHTSILHGYWTHLKSAIECMHLFCTRYQPRQLAMLSKPSWCVARLEPPHGVLGSWENGGQNNQGARSKVRKSIGSREQRNWFREQKAEENV